MEPKDISDLMRAAERGEECTPPEALWSRVEAGLAPAADQSRPQVARRRKLYSWSVAAASLLLVGLLAVQGYLGTVENDARSALDTAPTSGNWIAQAISLEEAPTRRVDPALYEGVEVADGTPGVHELQACVRC